MKSLRFFAGTLVVVLLFGIQQASATIICSNFYSPGNDVIVTIQKNIIKVQMPELKSPMFIESFEHVFDGNRFWTYTSDNFVMRYENQYGCIRNVEVAVTLPNNRRNIQTYHFDNCLNKEVPVGICY